MDEERNSTSLVSKIVLISLTVLSILCASFLIFWPLFNENVNNQLLISIPLLILCVVIVFYGCFGYKIPNSNIVRTCCFLFGAVCLLRPLTTVLNGIKNEDFNIVLFVVEFIVAGLVSMSASFMAGRLKKINNCIVTICIVGFGLIAMIPVALIGATGQDAISAVVSVFGLICNWAILAISYIVRYEEFRSIKKENEIE